MSVTISAEKRKARGGLNQLRNNGRIPAVIYGKGKENLLVHVDESEFRKKTAGAVGLLTVQVGDQAHQVMVRDIQKDPIKANVLHIDFHEVQMDQPIETEVPLHLTGEAEGIKEGGILQQPVRSVLIRCLPDRIPEELTVNIESLQVNDVLKAEALKLPEGVELLTDAETVIASIVPPQAEPTEEAEPVAEEGTAEPDEEVEK